MAAGFALLLLALAITLLQSAPRSSGSNYVGELEEVAKLRGPDRRCQGGEFVPGDTGALRLLIGTYGRPAPALRVVVRRPGGQVVTSGSRRAGGPEGHVDIPVREVGQLQSGLRVCVSVGGGGRTVLYGAADRLRFEWLRPGSESWLGLAPTIAHRFALGRWNPLGALLLPALACCWCSPGSAPPGSCCARWAGERAAPHPGGRLVLRRHRARERGDLELRDAAVRGARRDRARGLRPVPR